MRNVRLSNYLLDYIIRFNGVIYIHYECKTQLSRVLSCMVLGFDSPHPWTTCMHGAGSHDTIFTKIKCTTGTSLSSYSFMFL